MLLPRIFDSLGSKYWEAYVIFSSPNLFSGLKYPRAHTATIEASGIFKKKKQNMIITIAKFFCDNFMIHML